MSYVDAFAVIMTFLYDYYFLRYCSKFLPRRLPEWVIFLVFPLCNVFFFFWLINLRILIPLIYTVNFILNFFVLRLSFRGRVTHIFWAAVNVTFHTIVIRGITLGAISLILRKNMYQILQSDNLYSISLAAAMFFMALFLFFFNRNVDVPKIKLLLNNPGQLRFMSTAETIMLSFLLFASYSYYYNLDLVWFTLFHLLTCIMVMISFYVVFAMSLRTVVWMEEELNNGQIREQMQKQVRRHERTQQLEENIRKYNHDFNKVLRTVNTLLQANNAPEAQRLLNEMGLEVNKNTEQNKIYSNNIAADSILSELFSDCSSSHIAFEGECFVPEGIRLTELELCRVLNNLCANALEACTKQPDTDKKWISLHTQLRGKQWVLCLKNSFDGNILLTENELLTTKRNKDYHGLGIKSIHSLVENANGFCQIQVDREAHVFAFSVSIPVVTEGQPL
ncbi:MAG: GHKL domain-containing protein [Oscillospiraceae bacterium]